MNISHRVRFSAVTAGMIAAVLGFLIVATPAATAVPATCSAVEGQSAAASLRARVANHNAEALAINGSDYARVDANN